MYDIKSLKFQPHHLSLVVLKIQHVTFMAARPENVLQGYDVSRFIGEVQDDLLCIVCQDVPKSPRCCRNKDHLFCQAHILRHLQQNSHTCPET